MNKLISVVLILLAGQQLVVEARWIDYLIVGPSYPRLRRCIEELKTEVVAKAPIPAELVDVFEGIKRREIQPGDQPMIKFAQVDRILLAIFLSGQLKQMPEEELRKLREVANAFKEKHDNLIGQMKCKPSDLAMFIKIRSPKYDWALTNGDHEALHQFNAYYELSYLAVKLIDNLLAKVETRKCVKKVLPELEIPSEFKKAAEYIKQSGNTFNAARYNEQLGAEEADQLYLVAVDFDKKAKALLEQNGCDLESVEGLGDITDIKIAEELKEDEQVENFSGYLELSGFIKAASEDENKQD